MNWKRVNAYYGENEGFSSIPKEPGNYAIFTSKIIFDKNKAIEKNNKLYYIGTACNLYNRLLRHEVLKVMKAMTDDYIYIKCVVIKNETQRKDREYRLIKRLKPGINNEPKKRRLTRYAFLCG